MATTVNSDTIIYNKLAQTAYLERIKDRLDVFNASSKSAILLANEAVMGDFVKEAFYKISGQVEYRDVNDESMATSKKIGMAEKVGVKTPWLFGPYETTEEAFKRRARSLDEFAMLVGQEAADAAISYFIGVFPVSTGINR